MTNEKQSSGNENGMKKETLMGKFFQKIIKHSSGNNTLWSSIDLPHLSGNIYHDNISKDFDRMMLNIHGIENIKNVKITSKTKTETMDGEKYKVRTFCINVDGKKIDLTLFGEHY